MRAVQDAPRPMNVTELKGTSDILLHVFEELVDSIGPTQPAVEASEAMALDG